MRDSISIFRRLPIESYFILLTGWLTFLYVFITDLITHKWGLNIDPRQVLMGPMVGEGLMRYTSITLICYGGLMVIRYFTKHDHTGTRGMKRALKDPEFFRIAHSAFYWFLVSGAFVLGLGATFNMLFRSFSYEQMARASEQLMHWDKALFGVYPTVYLNSIDLPYWIQLACAYAYSYLPFTLAVLLTLLFCTHQYLFREVFLSLTIATFISLPFWIAYPGVSPNEMYRLNVFHKDQFTEIAKNDIRDIHFQPKIKIMMDDVEKMWFDVNGKFFSVSTFPSTHIIWATILLYAGLRVRWWIGMILIPFYIANFTATMLILEHYAVDTLLGVVISGITIYCAHKLLQYEKKYLVDSMGLLSIFEAMDMTKHTKHIKKYLRRSRSAADVAIVSK